MVVGGGGGGVGGSTPSLAKENFYKAPKLIYTAILWYNFVVQSPPPKGEGTVTPPPPCELNNVVMTMRL